jgi:hypothetical protein
MGPDPKPFKDENAMNPRSTLTLLVAIAWFSAGASFAADTAGQKKAPAKPAGGQTSFAALDDDRDGGISRTEASEKTQLLVDFDRIDLDRDDRLEPAEYASFYSAGYR